MRPTFTVAESRYEAIQASVRMRSTKGEANPANDAQLQALARIADRLENRLESLETILDADAPNWRSK